MKKALIFGINGQDGHYLSELLSMRGYRIFGFGTGAATDVKCDYIRGDISSERDVREAIRKANPDEIYNFAVFLSGNWKERDAKKAHEVNVGGPLNILSAIENELSGARLFQASTAYMFKPQSRPLDETCPFAPANEHAKTKLEAHLAVASARKRGIFASCGILFNHESPLRGQEFLFHKVTHSAAMIKLGQKKDKLHLGSMDSVRDWGYAGDFVEAMASCLSAQKADDYVIATGNGHSVRDVVQGAFSRVGLRWEEHVLSDRALIRDDEVPYMVGNPAKIKNELGWEAKTSFESLVGLMVESDIRSGAP